MGAVAKGNRSQVIGFSCRLVAGLSPMALFFPTTNLLHLLQRDVKHDIYYMIKNLTYSSDKEYRALRWALRSMTILIITDVRKRGILLSSSAVVFSGGLSLCCWSFWELDFVGLRN
jgi:hypothetical protein